ncbi:5-carboxymethyl-2-hydroxymuconate semialdehyde dehydrogenase [Sphingobium jiangsuense]|uniref:Acyl-CoA reductase-like NAD-dependent aldehyde dehydrogenase n=1 Tax=Sphingobium jiangsuense TaxID=870476 RepID=A0A7W6FQF5_9SPHN|nr:aldehyde dehydrogenase family protein [Sphingobium jiangsuense]MBB3925964.1 acyl-CoA reductase-like NAD-dependent aldehyde dehydrogenase [Sphingobium jiangsuense]GLS98898.1 5-carboxymethyl-2-hydroxymuconate semialdehyde dehydrogenase [Sphingobium jiangsuense]
MSREITSFIDGAFVAPRANAHRLPVINPATEEEIGILFEADEAEVDRAVAAAKASFAAGHWRRLSAEQRATVFRRICALTAEHADELCALETMDLGIPTSQARGMVTARVIRNFSFYADHLSQAAERAVTTDDLHQRYVHREPVGICALLTPWNAPLMLATSKIAPALAFGNSCVIKTSEHTPLALARFMTLLTEAGVPPGVVNLVNGRGPVTGARLSSHPDVGLVSFTGGGAAGRQIMLAAAQGFRKCDLELGGKSANIVSDSADFDTALDGSLLGIFANAGQMCFAGSRIIVQEDIADRFIEAFVERTRAIRVGDPADPQTEMGPLAFEAHLRHVLSFCAPQDDVDLLCGGKRADRDRGYFMQPTVLRARSSGARVCQEEIFGPVATILTYGRFEEAIAIANDSRYGLSGYLWTNRLDETMAAAQGMRTGGLMVNSPVMFDLRMPFGGVGESGVGREGIESLRNFYSEEKAVAIATRPFPMPIRLGAR